MTIAKLAAEYAAATETFLNALSNLDPASLDRHEAAEWSARQVIHHLADSEAQSYARLRRLVAEPAGSVIQGYDEGAWAENPKLGYSELPIETAVAVFKSVREASHLLLSRLDEADLQKSGVHTESGVYTIADWVRTYSQHPLEHLDQLLRAVNS